MDSKILVIVGPTATGKTNLGLKMAKEFNGEIISADSRQVYKELNIGTGKELPINPKIIFKNAKISGYYLIRGVKIWGYDLVESTGEFSVAQYINFANSIAKNIWKRQKLPVLVGGTGLYIRGVIDGITTSGISRNDNLRRSLENKNAKELFTILAAKDPTKAGSMNISDSKNPRRLIRAIEISENRLKVRENKKLNADTLFIGLKIPRDILNERIKERVTKRLRQGFEKEIKNLLKNGVGWKNQSMKSLGYRQFKDYVLGKISKEEAIERWISKERQYAKRQMTWFKKDKRIKWFEVKEGYKKSVEELVNSWYS